MSPRTAKQNEGIRQQKRQQIMDTALQLFALQGYHSTSISEIAYKAGISKGLMYNYFESKEELLKAILYDGFNKLLASFDPNHDGILTRDELILLISDVLEQSQREKQFWKLYMSLMIQPTVLSAANMKELNESFSYMFSMLTNYYKDKGVKNPLAEATLFHSIMDGVFINLLHNDKYPIKEVRQLLIERFI